MLLGVVVGLAIAIGLALLIVIYESAFPHTALLGRVGNTTIYRNVKQFPNSQVCDSHRIYLQIPSVLPHDPVLQHRLQSSLAITCWSTVLPRHTNICCACRSCRALQPVVWMLLYTSPMCSTSMSGCASMLPGLQHTVQLRDSSCSTCCWT